MCVLSNHYEVDEASDGQEALDKILADNYDLIILDGQMPKLEGPQVIEELTKTGKKYKILFSSGTHSAKSDLIVGYLPKPYSISQLQEAVKQSFNQ